MGVTNEDIARFFGETPVRISGNVNLRVPQIEGHDAAVRYFGDGGHRAVEQIPVGCGKTGLITLLPFGIARGRVLVIAPNLTIKRQLRDAFDITSPNCFYRKVGALTDL
jgi:superfamily II DNA or RNA helicase